MLEWYLRAINKQKSARGVRALLDIGRLGEAIGRRSAYWTPCGL